MFCLASARWLAASIGAEIHRLVCCESAPTTEMASQGHQIKGDNGDGGRGAASNDGVVPHQDVLYEILLRVPARPLCRFRAVCQSWRSLLSDPQFAAAHAAHHRGDVLFVVCAIGTTYGHNSFAEIRLLDTSGCVVKRVKAGLISLWQMLPHLDQVLLRDTFGGTGAPMRILDLATGTVSILPSSFKDVQCSFVFGRAVSSTGGHGEYKVLSLDTNVNSRQPVRVLTVDRSGGTWRAAPRPPVTIKTFGIRTGVASKGVIYHLVDNNNCWSIAAFDLEAEQWWPSLIQGPEEPMPSIIDSHSQRSLAEMNGCLAAVSTRITTMDIWLLMCSGNWSKQCRVCTWPFLPIGASALEAKPLSVLDDGRIAFWLCFDRGTAGLWMYDPRTETCTEVVAMEKCLNIGLGVYTGNLLRQLQPALGVDKL
ncbi:unnamed protein product [Urochloa decumbens]|uniref:F-box domain-containing protein n=1 Tax=Urochloa decumbens TaxID=240449 RepID=A0ABC9G761_9POAL